MTRQSPSPLTHPDLLYFKVGQSTELVNRLLSYVSYSPRRQVSVLGTGSYARGKSQLSMQLDLQDQLDPSVTFGLRGVVSIALRSSSAEYARLSCCLAFR